jgi:hypothetical protein
MRPTAEGPMSGMMVSRFDGDVSELTDAYDRAHALIMNRGGAGFPPAPSEMTILELHATEPPL